MRPGMIQLRPQAYPMLAPFIEMEFDGHTRFLKGLGKIRTIFRFDGMVSQAMKDKTGRGFGGDMELIGKFLNQFRRRIGSQEIFPST